MKMLTIAIGNAFDQDGDRLLIVNGQPLQGTYGYESLEHDLHAYFYSTDAGRLLDGQKLRDLASMVSSLYMSKEYQWNSFLTAVEFYFKEFRSAAAGTIRFKFDADSEEWRNPYSVGDYGRALSAAALNHNSGIRYYQEDLEFFGNGFGLECDITSLESTVQQEIARWSLGLRRISDTAMELVLKVARQSSVVTLFDFPPPVKSACEQYLAYFAQFLSDLGISVESEIKEEAGRVLFSVTPKDGSAALGRIREALEIYLDLPRNPEFSAAAGAFGDTAVAQLKANVLFLQSQLALSQAILETKNATIASLNATIFQQRQLLNGTPLINEAPSSGPEAESEPILGDTVHLTKYEGKVLKIDLPTILRRLKRSFGIGSESKEPDR